MLSLTLKLVNETILIFIFWLILNKMKTNLRPFKNNKIINRDKNYYWNKLKKVINKETKKDDKIFF